MGWLLCVWQMFSDAHLCLRVLSECVRACECLSVGGVVFSSHLDSLNGSVDINLFSWMAIVRRWEGLCSL